MSVLSRVRRGLIITAALFLRTYYVCVSGILLVTLGIKLIIYSGDDCSDGWIRGPTSIVICADIMILGLVESCSEATGLFRLALLYDLWKKLHLLFPRLNR